MSTGTGRRMVPASTDHRMVPALLDSIASSLDASIHVPTNWCIPVVIDLVYAFITFINYAFVA